MSTTPRRRRGAQSPDKCDARTARPRAAPAGFLAADDSRSRESALGAGAVTGRSRTFGSPTRPKRANLGRSAQPCWHGAPVHINHLIGTIAVIVEVNFAGPPN